jgi:hypothetical protein
MSANAGAQCEREYDFALIVGGVPELTEEVEDALYEAGCDDATVSMQYGLLYIEFSRSASSLQDAILSAIHQVQDAEIGAVVHRVDDCNLISASEIARRIGRSRQLVHQYMTGQRGPGGFPPPECYITDGKPLWAWCAVSFWLSENGLLRPEASWDAEVVAAINNVLEMVHQRKRHPELIDKVLSDLEPVEA